MRGIKKARTYRLTDLGTTGLVFTYDSLCNCKFVYSYCNKLNYDFKNEKKYLNWTCLWVKRRQKEGWEAAAGSVDVVLHVAHKQSAQGNQLAKAHTANEYCAWRKYSTLVMDRILRYEILSSAYNFPGVAALLRNPPLDRKRDSKNWTPTFSPGSSVQDQWPLAMRSLP